MRPKSYHVPKLGRCSTCQWRMDVMNFHAHWRTATGLYCGHGEKVFDINADNSQNSVEENGKCDEYKEDK